MVGDVLLDTNIAILILNRQLDLNQKRREGFQAFLCLTVVGELLFGAGRSLRPEANRQKVLDLVELCPAIPADLGVARRYGELKSDLLRRGRPIPENDLWIAAFSLRHDLTLVTRDRHFDPIDGLKIEAW